MPNRSTFLRFVLPIALVTVVGCAGLAKSPMRYLGEANEIADVETPDGFQISPADARDIIFARKGPDIFTDHYFVDDSNYYVINAFRLDKSRFSARKHGIMINGQTGEVYNRTTQVWETDPPKHDADGH